MMTLNPSLPVDKASLSLLLPFSPSSPPLHYSTWNRPDWPLLQVYWHGQQKQQHTPQPPSHPRPWLLPSVLGGEHWSQGTNQRHGPLLLSSAEIYMYSKTCLKRPLKKNTKNDFQYKLLLNASQKYCRMLQGEHSAMLSTCIKLPNDFKSFVLSIFEWPLKTGFTVIINPIASIW